MGKYRVYKKELDYSYTLGVFLTIELLENKPKEVETVLIHSKGKTSSGIDKVIQLCQKHHILMEENDKLIEQLSPKENCFAIGIFQKFTTQLAKTLPHLVLVNPSDSGNLGTIIRTALGFDVLNLAIIKPGVDIFDPKTIRASMGALFHIQFAYYDTFAEYNQLYGNHDLYPFMLKAKKTLTEISCSEHPYSLIFGNEGKGLDDSFLEIGTSLIIPHSHQIDSLNLAIATGIALYEFSKRKKTF